MTQNNGTTGRTTMWSLDWWAVIVALVFAVGVKIGAIIRIPW